MSTNKAIPDLSDWISQAEAARLRGITRQAVSRLIQRGRLETLEIGGAKYVRRAAVIGFEPAPAGRKAKS